MKKKRVVKAWALYSKTRKCIVRDQDDKYYIYFGKFRADYSIQCVSGTVKAIQCQITYEIPTKKRGKV